MGLLLGARNYYSSAFVKFQVQDFGGVASEIVSLSWNKFAAKTDQENRGV